MDKKKVLLSHYSINSKDRWGRIFPLARALAKRDFSVTLFTSASKTKKWFFYDIKYIDDVKIISYNDIIPRSWLSKGIGLVSLFSRIMYSLTHKFDYVYSDCGELPNAGLPCKINQWIYKAVYISESGDIIGRGGFYDRKSVYFKLFLGWYYLWADLYFRRSANIVVVLSEQMKAYMISRGIHEKKIIIIPGGAACDIIPYVENRKPKSLKEMIVFGYIGIDDAEVMDLIPLINIIQEDKYSDKFRIVSSGKKLSETIIRKYNLNKTLVEYGWIDFYHDFSKWACVDVFLLMKINTDLESAAWPNKLGDYLSIGRPVLITPYGDVKRFVQENMEGFIPIAMNRESIIKTLDDILLNKYDLKLMGKLNRKIAEQRISWDARVSELTEYLRTEFEAI